MIIFLHIMIGDHPETRKYEAKPEQKQLMQPGRVASVEKNWSAWGKNYAENLMIWKEREPTEKDDKKRKRTWWKDDKKEREPDRNHLVLVDHSCHNRGPSSRPACQHSHHHQNLFCRYAEGVIFIWRYHGAGHIMIIIMRRVMWWWLWIWWWMWYVMMKYEDEWEPCKSNGQWGDQGRVRGFQGKNSVDLVEVTVMVMLEIIWLKSVWW